MSQSKARPEGLSAYIAVTAAYWAFMLTDGALRMLVLLHFHTLGFSPVLIHYLLMSSISITVVGAFESVGAILVLAAAIWLVREPVSAAVAG